MKRYLFAFSMLLVLSLAFVLPCAAQENGAELSEEQLKAVGEALPDELLDTLGSEMFEDQQSFASGVDKLTSPRFAVGALLEALGLGASSAAGLLLTLVALVALTAAAEAFCSALSGGLGSVIRTCSSGAIIGAVIYVQYGHFEEVGVFFERLLSIMGVMLPVTTGIWAMGGNVSTAAVAGADFGVMLGVCQWLFAGTVVPVCCALSVLAFCDALCEDIHMAKIMSAIKKIYGFVLTLTMTLLLSCLSAQTAIAAAADSTAARTARLVSTTVIPGLGGGVGETFRTLGTAVLYLKNVFGVGGIIIIALLALPTLCSLLLCRMALMIAAGFADMLGCSSAAALLENLTEVYGCMLGVVCAGGISFVLALCVFIKSVVAVL